MLKNYIYRRLLEAKRSIKEEIHMNLNIKASELDFNKARKRVLETMNVKTFPKWLRDQTLAILDWEWERAIQNNILYPAVYKGKLYSKWKHFPEELKEIFRQCSDGLPKVKVFSHHFTEGMNIDYSIDTWATEVVEVKK